MVRSTDSAWRGIASKVQQFVGERLRDTPQLLHKRLSVPYVVGIAAFAFLLPYVLWGLTSTSKVPAPVRTLEGVEIQQLLTALNTALSAPALGRLANGAPAPFALQDVDAEIHFVMQKSPPSSGASSYRLMPVDTTVQARPEHVQTLKMRLMPNPVLANKLGPPASSTVVPRASEETGLPKPTLPKKRDKP